MHISKEECKLSRLIIIRHGETEWTASGQHTGRSDIPLTPDGEKQAHALRPYVEQLGIDHVFMSPLQRVKKTAQIIGLAEQAVEDPDLLEIDYGDFEGKTTAEIQETIPGWNVFSDVLPNGESLDAVTERADRLLHKVTGLAGTTAVVTSGHFSRVIGLRWLDMPAELGKHFKLSTASVSICGFEHIYPVIELWNVQIPVNSRVNMY
ncbi:MAG: Acid phosphatase [Chlamydiia bacterium]|nr:Acid phosphatase [Chlamydiia bacterium]